MDDNELTRRHVLKLGAAAAMVATAATVPALAQVTPRTFLTAAELAALDDLSELIVPADDHSPGARAAKVAAYIDSRLAEAFDPSEQTMWRDGLRPYVEVPSADRLALLTKAAANEQRPQTPDERFFVELKSRVVDAYYSSEIGIKDMDYKGNVPQAEFSGTDVSVRQAEVSPSTTPGAPDRRPVRPEPSVVTDSEGA